MNFSTVFLICLLIAVSNSATVSPGIHDATTLPGTLLGHLNGDHDHTNTIGHGGHPEGHSQSETHNVAPKPRPPHKPNPEPPHPPRPSPHGPPPPPPPHSPVAYGASSGGHAGAPRVHTIDNGDEKINVTLTCTCYVGSGAQNFTRVPLNGVVNQESLGLRCDHFARSSCRRQCIEMANNNATYDLKKRSVQISSGSKTSNGLTLQQYLCELSRLQETDVAVIITSAMSCSENAEDFQLTSQRMDMTALSPYQGICNLPTTTSVEGLIATTTLAGTTVIG